MITEEHRKELEELALGFETAAFAEGELATALAPYRARFNDNCRDTKTMRRLRVLLDAEAAARRATKSAAAVRAALAALKEKP